MTNQQEFKSKIKRVLITEAELQERIKQAGSMLSEEYQGKPLLLVSILKGAFVFLADLCREITIPCEIDFMATKSYYGEMITYLGMTAPTALWALITWLKNER